MLLGNLVFIGWIMVGGHMYMEGVVKIGEFAAILELSRKLHHILFELCETLSLGWLYFSTFFPVGLCPPDGTRSSRPLSPLLCIMCIHVSKTLETYL